VDGLAMDENNVRLKIKSLDELTLLLADRQNKGSKVVLAHGVFDLLHIGHIRHLEAAANEGNFLVVTLTADKFVNKGPDRPVFSELLRAEAVAALEYVDLVAINYALTAENVIVSLRPDIYVKGAEYSDAGNDLTGKITVEEELLRSQGGKIVYTKDVVFSSSSLINQYLNVFEPNLKSYLEGMRKSNMLQRISELADDVINQKVLMIGDAIIDEYQYVEPLGKSPKENMIATRYQDKEIFAGGVIAAANHVADFCSEIDVICCLGEGENSYEGFIRSVIKPNVNLHIVTRPGKQTTKKTRFIDTGYGMRKLFELYHMDDDPIETSGLSDILALLEEKLTTTDLTIVTDFGHGLLANKIIEKLCLESPFLAINAQSNSANLGFNLITKYSKADYICLDQPEARLAVGDNDSNLEEIVGEKLPSQVECRRIIVTAGNLGCYTYDNESGLSHAPALTNSIVDTVGAGDAFFVISALFVKAGASIKEASFVGNAAGALKVGIVGHRQSILKVQFLKFITTLLK